MFGVGAGAGNSLPVRKLMVAVLLAAAATCLGIFAVAQAQAANGAMTGVTLTSGSPGTLTVSWNTPSPAPTDYRLRWAPVGSGYLSWKGTNETDRGNAYPAGDATSLTLSGLSEGTEFKVQARARYHKGEHKSSPWSGPWVEVRAWVMSQPSKDSSAAGTRDSSAPAAPSMMGTSVSPEGRVLLLWLNPADDSITGYQVLRGPDAGSLVVIEQDTGSSGTTYTDTAPPAGQTHTYAVKARNASGLSELSNTLTATVPASEEEEEEEEELVTAQQNQELFLVSNLDTGTSSRQFTHQISNDHAKFAQSFSAANNADGATAEFDFHGITVKLGGHGGFTVHITASDVVVTLNSDDSGEPGALIYTLTPPPTISAADSGTRITFTAPPGSTLSSGVTYWLKIETATDSTHFDRNYIHVYFALDDGEVQGPATENRWSIGDTHLKSPQALSWETDQTSLAMAVHGAQLLGPLGPLGLLVSNLGQTTHSSVAASPFGIAQSFVAGPPGPAGFNYRFQGIRVLAAGGLIPGSLTEVEQPQVRAGLHRDNGGRPGSLLHRLEVPPDFASTNTLAEYTLSASPGAVLRGGATYWIVLDVLNVKTLAAGTTSSTEEDQAPPPVDGWLINNRRHGQNSNGAWIGISRVIKLAVLGEPAWVTDEADGPDLPGAGHNAHKTGAVVTPGIVSTGHLTAGLDRDYGLTGDYWWLDTQWGHSYRIEVKFGDSPNTATGGSAWVYFIDGDRRGTCCDSDHNRNDGYTVLHIKHDQNRKYLIEVVVFDKLNEGSAKYNGPYTITMTDITGTDITGTDKLVSNLYLGTLTKVASPVGTERQYALNFTTGHNPGGYKLDRIRTHIPDGYTNPVLTFHTDTSFAPGAKLCNFRNPTQVQHHLYWEDFPAPVPFLAPDCADVTLTANTKYWIVFAGTGYTPVVTDSDGESTRESGWYMGNISLTKTTGAWGDLTGGVIAAEIWATTDLSRTRPDVPSVTVSFEQGTYTVAEGGTVEVTVTLDPDPERTVTIPITKANQDGASNADYSGVPANVTFNNGDTSESFTFTATDDTVDDDDESVQLGFGVLPTGVSTGGSTPTSTVSITDNDDPAVVVSFGSAAYTVAEGGTVEVTVTLDSDPERTVTIPITKANQGTASAADYSGVPANVVFNSGETEKSITFSATQDTIDDDGESVRLAFGSPLPTDVTAASPQEAVVSITDDDVPSVVVVSFGSAAYTVAEGGTVKVTVTLDPDPERTVTIPITKANQGTASDADYSGVPANVVFGPDEREQTFMVRATDDAIDDDGESVQLGFGVLPTGVSTGGTATSTVSIADDDVPSVRGR